MTPEPPTPDTTEPGGKASSLTLRVASLDLRPEWDVVVIGAGPAGAVSARELARRGASVLLVDKAIFPRTKVCGGCLNGAAVAALQAIGLGHVAAECRAVPLRSVRLAAGRSSAELALPAGVVLSRAEFDAALVREAVAAGVTFAPGTVAKCGETAGHPAENRLVELHRGPDRARVRARVVVAANGLAGQPETPPEVAPGSRIGCGIIVPDRLSPGFFAPGTVFMATGRGGYLGLSRLADDRLDVAAAFDPDFVRTCGGLGAAAEALLARTGWPSIPGFATLPWKGTPALTRCPATVAAHRLFAVGDAAGYVEPFTGEGMAWAITSAVALAPVALQAARSWDDRLKHAWEQTHARIIGRRRWLSRAAAFVLRSPTLTGFVVRALAFFPALSHPVVSALNRPPTFHHGFPV